MTEDEARARRELGVSPHASWDEIQAAYRRLSLEHHPDLNAGDGERMKEINQAYETLKRTSGRPTVRARRFNGGDRDESSARESSEGSGQEERWEPGEDLDPVGIVRAFMRERNIVVLFDGSFEYSSTSQTPETRDDIDRVLRLEEINSLWMVDEILLARRQLGIMTSKSDIELGLRKVRREDRAKRKRDILFPLIWTELSKPEQGRAEDEWQRLAEAAFEADPSLTIAILKHFYWQMKRKQINMEIKHHLMPIIWSPVQGSGKTTIVQRLVSPVHELAVGPVLAADFTDRRNADMYGFAFLVMDDMDKVPSEKVPSFKSAMTGERLGRRRLGTSHFDIIRQRATLIGTANSLVQDLVPDPSGHRRFVNLLFRNGAETKGGDPRVWEIVRVTNYTLLCQSVDALAPSPIEPLLAELFACQSAPRGDDVRDWAVGLDVESEAVRNITTRDGVRAQKLYELYCMQTGSTISQTRFGLEMKRISDDPAVPFDKKMKPQTGPGPDWPHLSQRQLTKLARPAPAGMCRPPARASLRGRGPVSQLNDLVPPPCLDWKQGRCVSTISERRITSRRRAPARHGWYGPEPTDAMPGDPSASAPVNRTGRRSGRSDMKVLLTTIVAAGLTLSGAAFAQSSSSGTAGTSAASGATSANSSASSGSMSKSLASAQKVQQELKNAGFTDVNVVAESFVVQAKTKDGDPVVMTIGPHGMTVFEALHPGSAGSTGSAGSAGSSNNAGASGTSKPAGQK